MTGRHLVMLMLGCGLWQSAGPAAQADAGNGGASAGTASPAAYYYSYFKEQVPLDLATDQVALLQTDAGEQAEPLSGLEAFGLAGEDLQPGAIAGWWRATVPGDLRNQAGIKDLVTQIAEQADNVRFVSPVFVRENLPVVITPELLVGFHEGVTQKQARALHEGAAPGEISEVDFAGMKGVYRFQSSLTSGFDVLDAANELARRQEVKFAEPNLIFHARAAHIPNDLHFFRLWGLHNTGQNIFQGLPDIPELCGDVPCDDWPGGIPDFDMDAPEAWDITTGDESIIVVVLDGGVQQDHPDLNQIPGFDATSQEGDGGPISECDNHGTTVAGCVSATMDNFIGVVGIAPGCRVASARTCIQNVPCDGYGTCQSTWVVNSLAWAESIGARVTNFSWGVTPSSSITQKYTETHDAGMVHFASAGNDYGGPILYPSSIPAVNSVAALDHWVGGLADFSNYGPGLAFSAPGGMIATTDRTGDDGDNGGWGNPAMDDYTFSGGTSYASPYATGVAALILSLNPSLTANQVEQIMQQSAVDLGDPGYDTMYGWGMVNAYNAVLLVPPFCPADFNDDNVVNAADLAQLLGSWGPSEPCPPFGPADFNEDCEVNAADLAQLLGNWGPCK